MDSNELNRSRCQKQQTELHEVLSSQKPNEVAIQLFLRQHAGLHSAAMSQSAGWSFEDWILDDLTPEQAGCIPPGCEHSIAWLVWHVTRCEDITMNLLVAGSPQVLIQDNWLEKLGVAVRDTGNTMDLPEIVAFSSAIDFKALRAYRMAVGRRTQKIASQLGLEELKQKVDPARLKLVVDQGAVLPAAHDIVDFWGKRTVAGLLLMPASRHIITHWNEALKIKGKL